ncbi:MAG: hypothetical protein AAB611_02285 [Patescibacteria group bacterium]
MKRISALVLIAFAVFVCTGCDGSPARSASGVNKADVKVPTGADGLTIEQRNVGERLNADNKLGSIKHLYVISAYSGQVLIYSTVRGKVTSGGKRLTPSTIDRHVNGNYSGFVVNFGDQAYLTHEVLGDDGTYGSSGDYLFWWDTKGVYHQHYLSGGQILHISDQPLSVKSVIINMEISPTQTEAVPVEEKK